MKASSDSLADLVTACAYKRLSLSDDEGETATMPRRGGGIGRHPAGASTVNSPAERQSCFNSAIRSEVIGTRSSFFGFKAEHPESRKRVKPNQNRPLIARTSLTTPRIRVKRWSAVSLKEYITETVFFSLLFGRRIYDCA